MTKKITEAERLALRGSLVELMGEQQATTLMDSFPPIDYENLATRDDLTLTTHALRTEIGEVRVEMAELRTELRVELEKTRGEFRKDMATNTRMMIASNMASMLGFAALVIGFA